MAGGVRITRPQLEKIFKGDYEAIIQFELMLDSVDDIANLSSDNFDGVLSGVPGTSLQELFDYIDDLTTTNIPEGSNLYYTDARVGAYIESNILEYGYEEVTANATVTKTKTNFTGSTSGQTITLPTAGTSGREVEVFNTGSAKVTLSGSSVLSELYPGESACFTDTASDWVA